MWCKQGMDKGKDIAWQQLGNFRRAGGARGALLPGYKHPPGLACVAGHGLTPLLPPWRVGPGV